MKRDTKVSRFLRALNHFLVVFLLVAFVITCCMLLFVNIMASGLGLELTNENLNSAAKLTFLNVIFLSIIFSTLDSIRRRLSVYRPIKKITEAATRIAEGDFSVRIAHVRGFGAEDNFGEIIDCFNKMAEELSATETLQSDFISNVSHELKTPLSIIGNYSRMLKEENLSEEKRTEYAEAINASCRRLADLVSNILKLNKLENQQVVLNSEKYDLGEQLCECLLGFEEIWEKKNLQIETDIEDSLFVEGDREMMSLVWNNLFSNAIKFTDEGKISLRVKSVGEFAEVCISDTGCGISPETGAHIFDKFYQGDTSHSGAGNGLGLSLVKRIIDLTGSEISVESELGSGSRFTVRMRRV